MGDVGSQALMSVLAGGTDSDERRAAARLLGQLQVPQSLSLLKDVIEKDDDVLLTSAPPRAACDSCRPPSRFRSWSTSWPIPMRIDCG
jgi:hypothetical protein